MSSGELGREESEGRREEEGEVLGWGFSSSGELSVNGSSASGGGEILGLSP